MWVYHHWHMYVWFTGIPPIVGTMIRGIKMRELAIVGVRVQRMAEGMVL